MDVMQCNLWWHTSMMRVHFSVQTTFFLKPSPCYLKKKKIHATETPHQGSPLFQGHFRLILRVVITHTAPPWPLSDVLARPQYSLTMAFEQHLGLAPVQPNHHCWATSWLGPNTAQPLPLSDILARPQYSPTIAVEWHCGSAPIQPNYHHWATSWLGPSAAQLSPLSDMVWPQYSPTIAVERHLGLAPMQPNHHHWATSWLGPNTAQLSPLSDIMVWPQYSPTIAIERHLGSALMLFLSEEQCRGGN